MRCKLSKYKTYRQRVPLHSDAPVEKLTVPNLLDLQVDSFKRFLKEGIGEELKKYLLLLVMVENINLSFWMVLL